MSIDDISDDFGLLEPHELLDLGEEPARSPPTVQQQASPPIARIQTDSSAQERRHQEQLQRHQSEPPQPSSIHTNGLALPGGSPQYLAAPMSHRSLNGGEPTPSDNGSPMPTPIMQLPTPKQGEGAADTVQYPPEAPQRNGTHNAVVPDGVPATSSQPAQSIVAAAAQPTSAADYSHDASSPPPAARPANSITSSAEFQTPPPSAQRNQSDDVVVSPQPSRASLMAPTASSKRKTSSPPPSHRRAATNANAGTLRRPNTTTPTRLKPFAHGGAQLNFTNTPSSGYGPASLREGKNQRASSMSNLSPADIDELWIELAKLRRKDEEQTTTIANLRETLLVTQTELAHKERALLSKIAEAEAAQAEMLQMSQRLAFMRLDETFEEVGDWEAGDTTAGAAGGGKRRRAMTGDESSSLPTLPPLPPLPELPSSSSESAALSQRDLDTLRQAVDDMEERRQENGRTMTDAVRHVAQTSRALDHLRTSRSILQRILSDPRNSSAVAQAQARDGEFDLEGEGREQLQARERQEKEIQAKTKESDSISEQLEVDRRALEQTEAEERRLQQRIAYLRETILQHAERSTRSDLPPSSRQALSPSLPQELSSSLAALERLSAGEKKSRRARVEKGETKLKVVEGELESMIGDLHRTHTIHSAERTRSTLHQIDQAEKAALREAKRSNQFVQMVRTREQELLLRSLQTQAALHSHELSSRDSALSAAEQRESAALQRLVHLGRELENVRGDLQASEEAIKVATIKAAVASSSSAAAPSQPAARIDASQRVDSLLADQMSKRSRMLTQLQSEATSRMDALEEYWRQVVHSKTEEIARLESLCRHLSSLLEETRRGQSAIVGELKGASERAAGITWKMDEQQKTVQQLQEEKRELHERLLERERQDRDAIPNSSQRGAEQYATRSQELLTSNRPAEQQYSRSQELMTNAHGAAPRWMGGQDAMRNDRSGAQQSTSTSWNSASTSHPQDTRDMRAQSSFDPQPLGSMPMKSMQHEPQHGVSSSSMQDHHAPISSYSQPQQPLQQPSHQPQQQQYGGTSQFWQTPAPDRSPPSSMAASYGNLAGASSIQQSPLLQQQMNAPSQAQYQQQPSNQFQASNSQQFQPSSSQQHQQQQQQVSQPFTSPMPTTSPLQQTHYQPPTSLFSGPNVHASPPPAAATHNPFGPSSISAALQSSFAQQPQTSPYNQPQHQQPHPHPSSRPYSSPLSSFSPVLANSAYSVATAPPVSYATREEKIVELTLAQGRNMLREAFPTEQSAPAASPRHSPPPPAQSSSSSSAAAAARALSPRPDLSSKLSQVHKLTQKIKEMDAQRKELAMDVGLKMSQEVDGERKNHDVDEAEDSPQQSPRRKANDSSSTSRKSLLARYNSARSASTAASARARSPGAASSSTLKKKPPVPSASTSTPGRGLMGPGKESPTKRTRSTAAKKVTATATNSVAVQAAPVAQPIQQHHAPVQSSGLQNWNLAEVSLQPAAFFGHAINPLSQHAPKSSPSHHQHSHSASSSASSLHSPPRISTSTMLSLLKSADEEDQRAAKDFSLFKQEKRMSPGQQAKVAARIEAQTMRQALNQRNLQAFNESGVVGQRAMSPAVPSYLQPQLVYSNNAAPSPMWQSPMQQQASAHPFQMDFQPVLQQPQQQQQMQQSFSMQQSPTVMGIPSYLATPQQQQQQQMQQFQTPVQQQQWTPQQNQVDSYAAGAMNASSSGAAPSMNGHHSSRVAPARRAPSSGPLSPNIAHLYPPHSPRHSASRVPAEGSQEEVLRELRAREAKMLKLKQEQSKVIRSARTENAGRSCSACCTCSAYHRSARVPCCQRRAPTSRPNGTQETKPSEWRDLLRARFVPPRM